MTQKASYDSGEQVWIYNDDRFYQIASGQRVGKVLREIRRGRHKGEYEVLVSGKTLVVPKRFIHTLD